MSGDSWSLTSVQAWCLDSSCNRIFSFREYNWNLQHTHLKPSLPLSKTLPTVAFRCPGDLWLRQIIKECGSPIYSTSVNKSGEPVLDRVEDIEKVFGPRVDLIVDDGDKKGALPSTLVSLENGEIKVLRQGSVRLD